MALNKIEILVILTIIAMVGGLYFSTIREGYVWDGDFSLYVHHAKNIAKGIDYKNTGFIFNPFNLISPKTYPPVFPLLLSPIYKLFGLNIKAMQIEIILIFLVFLFIIFLAFRNELPFQYVSAIILIIGFNHFYLGFKDRIISDIPFLFFTYLALFIIQKIYDSKKSQMAQLPSASALLLGILIYFSYGTRSIGIVLILSFLVYDIIISRKLTQFGIIATLVFVSLGGLEVVLAHSATSYSGQFITNYKQIYANIYSYISILSYFWSNGYSIIFRKILFLIIFGLAVYGYLARIKYRLTIFEIFLPLYLFPIIIFNGATSRYFFPVFPLYIFYAFVGIEKIRSFQIKRLNKYVFAILIVLIFTSYLGKYTRIDFSPIVEGIHKKETIELFDYINKSTEKNDIFIFIEPRILSLYTGRSASTYHSPNDITELWNYFHKIGATCLITGPRNSIGHSQQEDSLYLFVEKFKDNLEKIYSNPDFKVYRIKKVQ